MLSSEHHRPAVRRQCRAAATTSVPVGKPEHLLAGGSISEQRTPGDSLLRLLARSPGKILQNQPAIGGELRNGITDSTRGIGAAAQLFTRRQVPHVIECGTPINIAATGGRRSPVGRSPD